eukprot:206417_1
MSISFANVYSLLLSNPCTHTLFFCGVLQLNIGITSFVNASMTEQLINVDVRAGFDEPTYDYLSIYLENTTTPHLHIVGHSLGGGIASIVAANLFENDYDSFITSFGVCSPGVLYSSAKFGCNMWCNIYCNRWYNTKPYYSLQYM